MKIVLSPLSLQTVPFTTLDLKDFGSRTKPELCFSHMKIDGSPQSGGCRRFAACDNKLEGGCCLQ